MMYWILVEHVYLYEKEKEIPSFIMWSDEMCAYLVVDIVSTSLWSIVVLKKGVDVFSFAIELSLYIMCLLDC